jgi:acyl dehydratase
MPEQLTVAELKGKIGQDYGQSGWITMTQEKINAFADCTGDHQWIHVDIEAAKKGPFGGPIAHGFLTLSLLPVFSGAGKYFPKGVMMAVNYGLNKVRFVNNVPVNSKIRSNLVLSDVEEKPGNRVLVTVTHTIEIEGQTKPACVAEQLTMFFLQP